MSDSELNPYESPTIPLEQSTLGLPKGIIATSRWMRGLPIVIPEHGDYARMCRILRSWFWKQPAQHT